MIKSSIVLLLVLSLASSSLAQVEAPFKARAHRERNEHRILTDFIKLLSIPNVASDRVNIRRNAVFITQMMKNLGLKPRLLEARTPHVPPAVYGEWSTPGARQTIVLYAHYDGQPTDPTKWRGTHPWQPALRSASIEASGRQIATPGPTTRLNPEWRLYARSASDDKAGVMAILTAFDAVRTTGLKFTSNLKFFFEGEEEAGSPHLAEIIRLNKDLLTAEAWIVCDGPVHQSGKKQVVFGVRGDTNVDITVYGARHPLHSGHYGNWAPNPALQLAQLLASMKDSSGKVTIAGWYDDVEPLGSEEQRAIAEAPQYEMELKKQLGFTQAEGAGKSLLELINAPSLNINGMSSGDTGALARNVIPTTATAVLDLRLVKGNDVKRQVERLRSHIRQRGFHITERDPTALERSRYQLIAKVIHRSGGYNAQRTRMDLPIALAVTAAVHQLLLTPL